MISKSIGTAPFRVARAARPLVAALVLAALATGARSEIRFEGPQTFPSGRNPNSVAAADFDENGTVDLTVANFGSDDVWLFLGDASGSFALGGSVPVGTSPTDVVSADVDSDGHADLVVVNFNGRSFSVLLGDGAGGFRSNREVSLSTRFPTSLIARDFDLDGRVDLAVQHIVDVAVALGDGAGGFAPAVDLGVPARHDVVSVDSGDFDEDGFLDLTVLALGGSPNPLRDRPSDVFILLGDGSGGFSVRTQFDVAPDAIFSLNHVVSDLDADGHLDIAVLDYYRGLYTFRGNGTGVFASGSFHGGGTSSGYSARPIAEDFSGDGFPDVVIGNTVSQMFVLESDGAGSFLPGVSYATGRYATGMTAADCDGDTLLDVALSIGNPQDGAGALEVFANRSVELLRRGNVNAGRGAVTDVLFVNDSAGGPRREIRVFRHVPFRIFMATPPAATGPAPFAAFVTIGAPDGSTSRDLPFAIGKSCLPMLASHGEPRPRAVFNNTGRLALGAPTHPSTPAPSEFVSRPSGIGRAVTFFVQGVIADPGSAALRPASLSNGVLVICD